MRKSERCGKRTRRKPEEKTSEKGRAIKKEEEDTQLKGRKTQSNQKIVINKKKESLRKEKGKDQGLEKEENARLRNYEKENRLLGGGDSRGRSDRT